MHAHTRAHSQARAYTHAHTHTHKQTYTYVHTALLCNPEMQYIVHVTVLYSVKLIYFLVLLDCGLQCVNGNFNGKCTECECDGLWIGENCNGKKKIFF